MGVSRVFDIARRSLSVYRQALDVTSHNVVNASNKDYTRQQVVFASEKSEMVGGIMWGTGVRLSEVIRVRDSLTDVQIRTTNQKYYGSNKQSELIGQIEQIYSEPGDLGLSNLISKFFNSWQELSVTPNSVPLRHSVIQAAQQLSSKSKSINEYLSTVKTDIRSDFAEKTKTLNQYLKDVQQLNAQIFEYSTKGTEANELIDRRDLLLDELSKLANINVTYDTANSASVSIGGIHAADRFISIEFNPSEVNGDLTIKSVGGQASAMLSGGELFAYADIYSKKIPKYDDALNEVMTTLIGAVNDVHSKGYTIGAPQLTGLDFFSGYDSGELKINEDILLDPRNIAISSDGTSGNGALAVQIGEISSKRLLNGSTLLENYSALISEIGNEKSTAAYFAESNKIVLDKLEEQKASYSGVSIDEEMTNIIKFQRSYDASAKLVKIADEMLQTILNMV
ncbi:MAG: flagellar hook-associated protein FlgK [Ignavibacteria bacterium]|nr:flagellar hook-associated protein FlgK [Ignavibacteria bacterium]